MQPVCPGAEPVRLRERQKEKPRASKLAGWMQPAQ
jgi:hypothetical protein